MKKFCAFSLCAAAFLAAAISAEPENNDEVSARKVALDLAGAFSNEGFKIRDGHWAGLVTPHDHALVAVNLYAGNQYWFSAGGSEKAKQLAVEVYDENGKKMPTEDYNTGGQAAAGFAPSNSGQFFVSIGLVEGEPSTLCLVYSYK